MDRDAVRAKFGHDYSTDESTFIMGIDRRFTRHFAGRLSGRRVFETCTGAGFTTISLAREADHVLTVEIDPARQEMAQRNVARAGLASKVRFMVADVMDAAALAACATCDAAFLDPDWAVTGPDHVYRFRRSNTQPPADELLERILELTPNVALVLPPLVDVSELDELPKHERQALYLDGSHELYCLYFGDLDGGVRTSEFRV